MEKRLYLHGGERSAGDGLFLWKRENMLFPHKRAMLATKDRKSY